MYAQMETGVADMQFLFCDIALVTLLAIVMGKGGPSDQLQPCRPPDSLLALPVLGSLFIYACMIVLGQLAALFITTSQDWSVKRRHNCKRLLFTIRISLGIFCICFNSINKIHYLRFGKRPRSHLHLMHFYKKKRKKVISCIILGTFHSIQQ